MLSQDAAFLHPPTVLPASPWSGLSNVGFHRTALDGWISTIPWGWCKTTALQYIIYHSVYTVIKKHTSPIHMCFAVTSLYHPGPPGTHWTPGGRWWQHTYHTQMLHGTGIFTYTYLKFQAKCRYSIDGANMGYTCIVYQSKVKYGILYIVSNIIVQSSIVQ